MKPFSTSNLEPLRGLRVSNSLITTIYMREIVEVDQAPTKVLSQIEVDQTDEPDRSRPSEPLLASVRKDSMLMVSEGRSRPRYEGLGERETLRCAPRIYQEKTRGGRVTLICPSSRCLVSAVGKKVTSIYVGHRTIQPMRHSNELIYKDLVVTVPGMSPTYPPSGGVS